MSAPQNTQPIAPGFGSAEKDSTGLSAVRKAETLAELVDTVPAPFRPRMQGLIERIYRASIKSNHARQYLASLDRHKSNGSYPPEIDGRVRTPAIQTSKEYEATAEHQDWVRKVDKSARDHKAALLKLARETKEAEIKFLQKLSSEEKFKEETEIIGADVLQALGHEVGAKKLADGSIDTKTFPEYVKEDIQTFSGLRLEFCRRAIALAFVVVQKEVSRRNRTLQLKQSTDEDVEMQDASSRSETIESLVDRRFDTLLNKLKVLKPGLGNARKSAKPKPNSKVTKTTKNGKPKPAQGKGKGKKGKNGGKK